MALRSFFVLYPGLSSPQQFKATAAPELLTFGELWDAARNTGPALLFRVLTEKRGDPGERLSVGDQLESCVGLVDSATRWRTSFRLASNAVAAIRHPLLSEACNRALAWAATSHPASVTAAQRGTVISEVMKVALAEATEQMPAAHPFEERIARGVASLIQADNDYEAAYHVPFLGALCPFSEETQQPQFAARMATLEALAGAALLDQASARLSERMAQWMIAKMPELTPPGAEED